VVWKLFLQAKKTYFMNSPEESRTRGFEALKKDQILIKDLKKELHDAREDITKSRNWLIGVFVASMAIVSALSCTWLLLNL
jgi:hypothetical protein